jgi:hypothetical protein
MSKLLIGMVTFTVRNVARHRNSGAADLLAQSIQFVLGQGTCTPINVSRQFHGFLPNSEIAKR